MFNFPLVRTNTLHITFIKTFQGQIDFLMFKNFLKVILLQKIWSWIWQKFDPFWYYFAII